MVSISPSSISSSLRLKLPTIFPLQPALLKVNTGVLFTTPSETYKINKMQDTSWFEQVVVNCEAQIPTIELDNVGGYW